MSSGSRPKLCLVHTGRALPQMLLGQGPDQVGGAELQLAQIAQGLHGRGWSVSFALCDHGHSLPPATPEGIGLVTMSWPRGGLPILRFFTHTLPANWRLLARTDADVYLQMGVGWQNGLVAWACRSKERRFVLWLASLADPLCADPSRSLVPPHERWLARYGLRHADLIIAQTYQQQALLKEYYSRESVIIPNIWPTADNLELSPPAQPPQVFWAGRAIKLKRPHLFLDAAEELPEFRFVMAAAPHATDTELYEQIKARASSIRNVEFLGFVPFREIDKYYSRATAYVCTSTVEGFPNTFLQAWSHGRPVVSTFDPDDVLVQQNLGIHCRNLEELVWAVRRAAEDSVSYAPRVHQYLRQSHSPEVILPQIEAVLSR